MSTVDVRGGVCDMRGVDGNCGNAPIAADAVGDTKGDAMCGVCDIEVDEGKRSPRPACSMAARGVRITSEFSDTMRETRSRGGEARGALVVSCVAGQ